MGILAGFSDQILDFLQRSTVFPYHSDISWFCCFLKANLSDNFFNIFQDMMGLVYIFNSF